MAGVSRLVNRLSCLLRCYPIDDNDLEVIMLTTVLLAVIQPPNPNAAAPKFDLEKFLTSLGGIAALILGLVIFVIAIKTAWARSGEGDISGSASSLGVVAIAVIIAALGAGGLALAYGTGMLAAITGLFS